MSRVLTTGLVFLFLLGTNLQGEKKDKNPTEIPPGTITQQAWDYVTEHNIDITHGVNLDKVGAENLISAFIEIEDGTLSPSRLQVLIELSNHGSGLKEIFADYMLLRSNHDLSLRALAYLTQVANNPPAAWIKDPAGKDKKLLAIKVLVMYQQRLKLASNKTQ